MIFLCILYIFDIHIVEELALALLLMSELWVNAHLHVVSEPLRGSLLSSPTTE